MPRHYRFLLEDDFQYKGKKYQVNDLVGARVYHAYMLKRAKLFRKNGKESVAKLVEEKAAKIAKDHGL